MRCIQIGVSKLHRNAAWNTAASIRLRYFVWTVMFRNQMQRPTVTRRKASDADRKLLLLHLDG